MRLCVKCGFQNREGYLFCEDCGFPLSLNINDNLSRTQKLSEDEQKLIQEFYFMQKQRQGHIEYSSASATNNQVKLALDGQECLFDLITTPKIVLGRKDVNATTIPDFDLTPFGAINYGVSRIHATIERIETTITIMDMGSSNGTYVNRRLLTKYQPQVLHNGDEIWLGKLTFNVYFMNV